MTSTFVGCVMSAHVALKLAVPMSNGSSSPGIVALADTCAFRTRSCPEPLVTFTDGRGVSASELNRSSIRTLLPLDADIVSEMPTP